MDGNFLTVLGLDVALLTAGSAGGFVKSVFARQSWRESLGTVAASALTGNYFGASAHQVVTLTLGSGVVFGMKITTPPPVTAVGFGVGFFAVLIFAWLQGKIAAATSTGAKP